MPLPPLPLLDRWIARAARPDVDAGAGIAGLRPAVVVTGGSEGIGLALAERFAIAGADVALVARSPAGLAAAADRIAARAGHPVATIPLDVTHPDAASLLDGALAGQGLYLDVLVNNAGIGLSGPFVEHAPEEVDRLVALDVAALTRLTHHALPAMLARGRGGILNVASLGGFAPGPYQAAYYAAKAYVIALTEAIAHEVRGQGVRISCLAPGPVDTGFHARMGAEGALYRRLLPAMSAARVADAGFWGYRLDRTLVVPGLLPPLAALALRVLPHTLSSHLIAALLRPARDGRRNADRQGS